MSQLLNHQYVEIDHCRSIYTFEIGQSYISWILLFLIPLVPPRYDVLVCPCLGPTVLPLPHAGKSQIWVKITACFLYVYMGLQSAPRETHKMVQIFVTMNS